MYVKLLQEAGYGSAMLGLSLSYDTSSEAMPERARKLAHKQLGHNKCLESIITWWFIKAPRYWWQEADTYRLSTKQSGSTMHTLMRRPLVDSDFEGGMDEVILDIVNGAIKDGDFMRAKRRLPESFLQARVWCLSYKTLQNIIAQRSTHKLEEWRVFYEGVLNQVEHPGLLVKGYPPAASSPNV